MPSWGTNHQPYKSRVWESNSGPRANALITITTEAYQHYNPSVFFKTQDNPFDCWLTFVCMLLVPYLSIFSCRSALRAGGVAGPAVRGGPVPQQRQLQRAAGRRLLRLHLPGRSEYLHRGTLKLRQGYLAVDSAARRFLLRSIKSISSISSEVCLFLYVTELHGCY